MAPEDRPSSRCADVTLVVVGYNCAQDDLDYLEQTVERFGAGIFVDNGPESHALRNSAWTRIVPGRNVGFAAAANLAVESAQTPLVLFLNPDVRASDDTLERLVASFDDDVRLGGLGPSLAPANSIYEANAGGADKSLANALVFAFAPARALQRRQIWRSSFPDSEEFVEVDWLSGACMLTRRDALRAVGGFPPDYFLYDEDVALGRTMRGGGMSLRVATRLVVSHRVGGSQAGSAHFRRWAVSGQRHLLLTSRSRRHALLTAALLCVGLLRRATWRAFLGRRRPYRYALWFAYYLGRYRLLLPAAGPDLPP